MQPPSETPLLLEYLFGDSAALARQAASPRLLRWCRAFDEWLAERRRECQPATYRHSKVVWQRLLQNSRKMPWELAPADLQRHVDSLREAGYAPTSLAHELGAVRSFYRYCARLDVDPLCGPGFDPTAGAVSYTHLTLPTNREV